MVEADLTYQFTCDAAPVQAEGMVCGYPFYFRARYEHWTFSVSEHAGVDPVDRDAEESGRRYGFFREGRYGTESFAASWMSREDAEAIIKRGRGIRVLRSG
jgi:hypothetical protein